MTTPDDLLRTLDAELALAVERRSSGGADETLQALRHRVRAADRLLATGQPEEGLRLLAEARSLAVASLRPGPLVEGVVGHADGVRARLADVAAAPVSGSTGPMEVRRRARRWILIGGGVLLVAWPLMIWAAAEFDLPALRMVASWSIAAVAAAAITAGATAWRDRRRR